MVNKEKYQELYSRLSSLHITLVAVSKTKPIEDIQALYDLGHRDFGENYVQEMVEKAGQLPADIRWHYIGHLQTNKVKMIAPFVQLIHGVDSLKLLKEIDKQGRKLDRVIDCLLQVHIAAEETKFGLNEDELKSVVDEFNKSEISFARLRGLMGMASFTEDMSRVRMEFRDLNRMFQLYRALPDFNILSMGMSSDYPVAIEEGANLVRIGSLLFGERYH